LLIDLRGRAIVMLRSLVFIDVREDGAMRELLHASAALDGSLSPTRSLERWNTTIHRLHIIMTLSLL
jgi:hypothetical protein